MDNNNLKICNLCGVANEPDYNFCKSCGSPLNQNTAPIGNAPVFNNQINGVATAEVHDYVGKNSDGFIPKFFRFAAGVKASWNWPAFVLGIFGINFVWFFYRKMYKIGVWLLVASLLITTITSFTLSTLFEKMEPITIEYIDDLIAVEESNLSISEKEYAMIELEAQLTNDVEAMLAQLETISKYKVLSILSELATWASLVLFIIIPIFADHLYYKKVFRDINKLNLQGNGNPYAVAAAGGTNTTAAVLIGIAASIASVIMMITPVITFVVNMVSIFI